MNHQKRQVYSHFYSAALRKLRQLVNTRATTLTALCTSALLTITGWVQAAEPLTVSVLYLTQPVERPPTLSTRERPPADAGVAGALLAIDDSNTTGRFLGQRYTLKQATVSSSDEAVEAVTNWITTSSGLIVADLPSPSLRAVMGKVDFATSGILFNATNPDDQWRSQHCQTGLVHTTPSRAMLADGLAQFLMARRWREWFLLRGPLEGDRAFVDAMQRSAKRFGAKVIEEKEWTFDTDLRRTAQSELPLFTQARSYDVVIVADEIGDVGEFVPYNTWLPRPVAGTQGMTPAAWSPVIEQWGALQLQNRFEASAQRGMTGADYGAWLAVRAIAEAVTRTGSNDSATLYNYLLSADFELAAFQGRSLTFRNWNGQIRQPITLVHPRAVVSQSPQTGFLHPRSELDTLGYDAPEVHCDFKDQR